MKRDVKLSVEALLSHIGFSSHKSLARAIGCTPPRVSRVLNGTSACSQINLDTANAIQLAAAENGEFIDVFTQFPKLFQTGISQVPGVMRHKSLGCQVTECNWGRSVYVEIQLHEQLEHRRSQKKILRHVA